jgi:hypothetical protein
MLPGVVFSVDTSAAVLKQHHPNNPQQHQINFNNINFDCDTTWFAFFLALVYGMRR